MSMHDPINFAATLLTDHLPLPPTDDLTSVLQTVSLGRRHSIAVHNSNDLKLFQQTRLNRIPFDRVKSQELESSVCDFSQKRRTSFCCPVELGSKAPPRKRRLSVCADSLEEQLIHSADGTVSSTLPYHTDTAEGHPGKDYLSLRRGSLPNFGANEPSQRMQQLINAGHFGPNSPFTQASFQSKLTERRTKYRNRRTSPPPTKSPPEQTQQGNINSQNQYYTSHSPPSGSPNESPFYTKPAARAQSFQPESQSPTESAEDCFPDSNEYKGPFDDVTNIQFNNFQEPSTICYQDSEQFQNTSPDPICYPESDGPISYETNASSYPDANYQEVTRYQDPSPSHYQDPSPSHYQDPSPRGYQDVRPNGQYPSSSHYQDPSPSHYQDPSPRVYQDVMPNHYQEPSPHGYQEVVSTGQYPEPKDHFLESKNPFQQSTSFQSVNDTLQNEDTIRQRATTYPERSINPFHNQQFSTPDFFSNSTREPQLFSQLSLPTIPSVASSDMNSPPGNMAFGDSKKSLNNFPLAGRNLDYIQQSSTEDIALNLNVHETTSSREKEEKKKGLKWTNVTATVTKKYAKGPKGGQTKNSPQLKLSAGSQQPPTDKKSARLVGQWKCTKYTV